jgi:hypothetical protein
VLIPLPIVRLNRATILLGVILAYVLHAPLITTGIFVVVALAAALGARQLDLCTRHAGTTPGGERAQRRGSLAESRRSRRPSRSRGFVSAASCSISSN